MIDQSRPLLKRDRFEFLLEYLDEDLDCIGRLFHESRPGYEKCIPRNAVKRIRNFILSAFELCLDHRRQTLSELSCSTHAQYPLLLRYIASQRAQSFLKYSRASLPFSVGL